MNLILPLTDSEEQKLLAKARAEGTTLEGIVRQALDSLFRTAPDTKSQEPKKSSRGALKHLGQAPSGEDIDEVRREMFANFARDDF